MIETQPYKIHLKFWDRGNSVAMLYFELELTHFVGSAEGGNKSGSRP